MSSLKISWFHGWWETSSVPSSCCYSCIVFRFTTQISIIPSWPLGVHICKRGSWGLVNQKWEVRPADRGITRITCLGLRQHNYTPPSEGFMCVMACHMCEEKTVCPYEICKSLPRNIRWPLVSEGNLTHLRRPPNTLGNLWNVIKLTIKSAKVFGDKLGNNNTKVV